MFARHYHVNYVTKCANIVIARDVRSQKSPVCILSKNIYRDLFIKTKFQAILQLQTLLTIKNILGKLTGRVKC